MNGSFHSYDTIRSLEDTLYEYKILYLPVVCQFKVLTVNCVVFFQNKGINIMGMMTQVSRLPLFNK